MNRVWVDWGKLLYALRIAEEGMKEAIDCGYVLPTEDQPALSQAVHAVADLRQRTWVSFCAANTKAKKETQKARPKK